MKYLLLIFLICCAIGSSANNLPKYGDYVAKKCHWMSCTSLKLSSTEITRTYRSDKLLDNSETTDGYIFEDNKIKTIHTKEKYHYFTVPMKDKPNCGFYLADEKLHQKCDGIRECVMNEAFHYNPKIEGKYPCGASTEKSSETGHIINDASIIIDTCPKVIKNLKNTSFTTQIWVTEDGQGKVAKMLRGTDSDESDIELLKAFKSCKYKSMTFNGKNKSSWLILNISKRNDRLFIN